MTIESKGIYRFSSSYITFQKCVDLAEKLLENEQLILLFGCKKKVNFSLNISKEQFLETNPDIDFGEFQRVLYDKIAIIIEQNIIMPDAEEPSLAEYLKESGVDEAQIDKMIREKADKRNYVQEKIKIDNASLRYRFKTDTMANKLEDLKYEINKYIFSDHEEMCYALIEFVSTDQLITEGIPFFLDNEKHVEKSRFVCDKQDLDYIIMQLQKIKEKL